MALPSIKVILSLAPIVQAAVDTIQSFAGVDDDDNARQDTTLQNALRVISSVAPLFETFANGGEVTEEHARNSLANYQQAVSDLDDEIAKQGG